MITSEIVDHADGRQRTHTMGTFTEPAWIAPPMIPRALAIRNPFNLPNLSPDQPDKKVPKNPPAKKTPLMAPIIVLV
jgi:hypothetical protein